MLSPLLANIYLHVLDRYWTERYLALGILVRYADDFVIVCRGKVDAEQAMEVVQQIMTKLKLQLHPAKTKLVNLKQEGFEFLGFHFRKVISRKSGKLVPLMWPGKNQRMSDAIRIQDMVHAKWSGVLLCDRRNASITPRMCPATVDGKPYEGKPHVRFEVAGDGNQGGMPLSAPSPDPTWSSWNTLKRSYASPST